MQAVIKDDMGQLVGVIDLDSANFSTGNTGYRGQAKVTVNGTKYQGQVILAKVRNGKK